MSTSESNTLESKCSGSEAPVLPLVVKTYFTAIIKDDGNFIDAVCDLCKPGKKVIRGQYKAPSNFSKHIKVS